MSQGKTKLGKYIAYLRTEKELTVKNVACSAKITEDRLHDYETGNFDFDPDELHRIAEVFEMTPNELFDFHLQPQETESLQVA